MQHLPFQLPGKLVLFHTAPHLLSPHAPFFNWYNWCCIVFRQATLHKTKKQDLKRKAGNQLNHSPGSVTAQAASPSILTEGTILSKIILQVEVESWTVMTHRSTVVHKLKGLPGNKSQTIFIIYSSFIRIINCSKF